MEAQTEGLAAVSNDDMDLLTGDEILNANDMAYEVVSVPEWSNGRTDKVRVKALTASERDDFESAMIVGKGKNQHVSTKDIRAHLVSRTVVDKNGVTVFSKRQIEALGKKSAAAMDRVYEVAARLSKITQEDVEELAGNSDPDQADAS